VDVALGVDYLDNYVEALPIILTYKALTSLPSSDGPEKTDSEGGLLS
jgi:hypothetical protein